MTLSPGPHVNDSDLDLLSAYLDHRLDDADRVRLEARLEREPELRQVHNELRATVAVLRDLPPARPPRSFTLDPATVSVRPRWIVPPEWLRFGSALAAMLLALTLTIDFVGRGAVGGSGAGAPAAERASIDTATGGTSATSAAASAAEMATMATAAPAAAAQAQDATELQSAREEPTVAVPEGADAAVGALQAPPAPAASAPEGASSTMSEPEGGSTTEMGPVTANAPVQASGSSSSDTQESGYTTMQDGTAQVAQPAIPPIRLIEVSLGALAVLLLLASFWVARR